MKRTEQLIGAVCGIILLIIMIQGIFPPQYVPEPLKPTAPPVACVGTAIAVDYPYLGTVNEPWTCKPQCDDQKARYILYSNGKATQCETPPGCNDTGEDTGVTCLPPVLKSTN